MKAENANRKVALLSKVVLLTFGLLLCSNEPASAKPPRPYEVKKVVKDLGNGICETWVYRWINGRWVKDPLPLRAPCEWVQNQGQTTHSPRPRMGLPRTGLPNQVIVKPKIRTRPYTSSRRLQIRD